uniref:FBA_2 domain-containing protein n=1 Tax=Steinernema glaseri TaxID=37863 RepID=A0A1I7ZYL3_9BILA
MDRVPIAFCEHVCDVLYDAGLSKSKKLSGNFGQCAQFASRHRTAYEGIVSDGEESSRYLEYNGRMLNTLEEIDAVPKKFVRDVYIELLDAEEESVSREIVKRFPYAQYHFGIFSSRINEACIDLMCSLKRLGNIIIFKELDDKTIQLFQKLVEGRKLSTLHVNEWASEVSTLEVIKTLLCQEQFKILTITNWNGEPSERDFVRKILQLWSESSEQLNGKKLFLESYRENGVEQLVDFLLQRAGVIPRFHLVQDIQGAKESLTVLGLLSALKVCSKEECDQINRDYHHNHTRFFKPSCVYKYEEGQGAERRRLYISFECAVEEERKTRRQNMPSSHRGHNDLSLMLTTTFLYVLFN